MARICSHLEKLADEKRKAVRPSGHGCKECLETGDEWAFCYPDDMMVDGVPALPGEAAARHYSAP